MVPLHRGKKYIADRLAAGPDDVSVAERVTRARVVKAGLIADMATRHGITAGQAARLDQEGRDALAGLAGARTPSEETWGLVVERLVLRESAPADPFEGLT